MRFIEKMIDKRISAYQSDLIETHFAEVDNMYRQMRGWRHDYRNHIQALKALTENLRDADPNNSAAAPYIERIESYLMDLEHDLKTVDTVIKTGNRMTDAILNSKISLARSRNIPVFANANIPVKLNISEIDLCIIIGNLFDNAIEASMALPESERMIRVYMDMKNTQLYISFTNFTASKKQLKENGRYKTTKGDGHGFGLVRIDTIIDRLGGYVNRASEDGAFTTEILLPQ